MQMFPFRMWPIIAVALLTTTCMRGGRPDDPFALQAREELPPISLVTADGVELALLSVDAKALLAEPLAFTELHLRFRNPEDRTLEGRFRVVLPPSAAVARFAMKVQGRWEEAELVELQQAREAYEMFLHRRQDPALLEHSAGNEFSARVFPIMAHEEKELILGYSEDLVPPDEPYRIALQGIRSSARAEITLLQMGAQGLEQRKLVVPTARDFEHPLVGGNIMLRHRNVTVARMTAPGETVRVPVRSLAVLFDTSASRALGLARQVELLQNILAEARGTDLDVQVLAFDQEVVPIHTGPASTFGEKQVRMLLERGALGASNLEKALRILDEHLARKPAERVLIIGDGVTTAGALDGGSLTQLTATLAHRGVKRLDAIVVGGVQDEGRFATLTVGGLAEDGAVLNGRRPAAWLWSRLTSQARRTKAAHVVENAAWQWPRDLHGILPGEPMLSIVRLESMPSSLPGAIELDAALAPLIERAYARAQITELEDTLDRTPLEARRDRDALKAHLIESSIASRVLCRFTGFVVLENDFAWQQTGTMPAATKIMSLDAKGLHLTPHERTADTRRVVRNVDEEVTLDKAEPVMESMKMPLNSSVFAAAPSRESGSSREESPTRKTTSPVATEPPSRSTGERVVLTDSAPLLGLPELPPEPDDTLRRYKPELKHATSPKALRQQQLPEPPSYRSSDFKNQPKAYTGHFGDIMNLLARGKTETARTMAEKWRAADPGQVLAQVALGEACRRAGDVRRAARAFGSIIDLFPARADLRRFAAGRLASLHDRAALDLAVDSAWRAVEQRPDHPSGHHLAATLLLEANRFREAFAVLTKALERNFDGRYREAERILREDAALVAEAWEQSEPAKTPELNRRLSRLGASLEDEPSLRFVLTWESDANDVDFHIRDGLGYHAFYAKPTLPTGGELYADVTDGYGPECFTLREPATRRAYPYQLAVRYARRGPMGYGMGTVQIIEHDGQGNLRFDHRPFVVMSDGGHLDLADVRASR
jgi:tetratricopeptide (TPR) repeat protein